MMKRFYFLFALFAIALASCNEPKTYVQDTQEYKDSIKVVCQDHAQQWILDYALYPESYLSLEFVDFKHSFDELEGERIENSDQYIMFHRYQILTRDSLEETVTTPFLFNHKGEVQMLVNIEKSAANTSMVSITRHWRDTYGRELTNKEKKAQKKKILQKGLKELEKMDDTEDPELKEMQKILKDAMH